MTQPFEEIFPDLADDEQSKIIWNSAIGECIAHLAAYANDDGHEGTVRKEGVRRLHDLKVYLSGECIVADMQYRYLVQRGFNGSFQCGTPIRLIAGSFIRGTELTAKYINTSQPFTLKKILAFVPPD